MNPAVVLGLLRVAVPPAMLWLNQHGFLTGNETPDNVITALVTLGSLGWTAVHHWETSTKEGTGK